MKNPLPRLMRDWPSEAMVMYHERIGMRVGDGPASLEVKRWAEDEVRRVWLEVCA